jgi:hypothetical protein
VASESLTVTASESRYSHGGIDNAAYLVFASSVRRGVLLLMAFPVALRYSRCVRYVSLQLLPGRIRSSLPSFSMCPPVSPLTTLHSLLSAVAFPGPSPSTPPLPHSRFHFSCTSTASLSSRDHFSSFSFFPFFTVRRLPALPRVFLLCSPLLHCRPLPFPIGVFSVFSGNKKPRNQSRKAFSFVRQSRPSTCFP